MKCPICKISYRWQDMEEHVEKAHSVDIESSEEEDMDVDPDYVPKDDTEAEMSSVSEAEKFEIQDHDSKNKQKKKQSKKTVKTSKKTNSEKPQSHKRKAANEISLSGKKLCERSEIPLAPLPALKPWIKKKQKKHRPRRVQRQTKGPSKRRSVQCPDCPLMVQHLPRHLRQAHDFSHGASLAYSKKHKYELTEKDPKRRIFICPVEGCPSQVQNISQHFWQVHEYGMSKRKDMSRYVVAADEYSDNEEVPLPRHINVQSVHGRPSSSTTLQAAMISDSDDDDNVPLSHYINPQPLTTVTEDSTNPNHDPNPNPEESTNPNHDPNPNPEESTNQHISPEEEITLPPDRKYNSFEEHPTLKLYYQYLVSIDRGKTETIARNMVKQVFVIWASIDPNMFSHSIFEGDLIRDVWVPSFKMQPGTKKSYLSSLRNFYRFVQFKEMEGSETVPKLLYQTDGWMLTVNNEERLRRFERRVEQEDQTIEPDHIKAFVDSEYVATIKSKFENAKNGDEISLKDHCAMRNYLMLMTLITNGQRTGALMNLNMRAFRHAHILQDGVITHVIHHKTALQGPVTLYWPNELWSYINIYVHKLRPLVPHFNEDHLSDDAAVFITYNADPKGEAVRMSQSVISAALRSIWGIVSKERAISATRLRKAVTTAVRMKHPELRDELAQQMTHRASTADEYYMLRKRSDNAVKVVDFITKVMKVATPIKCPIEKPVSCNAKEQPCVPNPERSASARKSLFSDKDNVPQSTRRAFSSEDSERIVRLCDGLIRNMNVGITEIGVVDVLTSTIEGRQLVRKYRKMYGDKECLKKFADRVRAKRRSLKGKK